MSHNTDEVVRTADTDTSRQGAEICSAILVLKRNVALYPEAHGVVTRSVETLKRLLASISQATGSPFRLETQDALRSVEDREAEGPDPPTLRRLLRRHLISRVTLLPDATTAELAQFCFLLRDELFRKGDAVDLPFDPCAWRHILVDFYSAEDLREERTTDRSLLRALSGASIEKGLGAWLELLPEELRDEAEKALLGPGLLADVAEIRGLLRSTRLGEAAGASRELIRELMTSVMPRPGRIEEVSAAARSVVTTLRHFARFVKSNEDVLGQTYEATGGGTDFKVLLERFAETLSSRPRIVEDVDQLQGERQRLAFLFQSVRGQDAGTFDPAAGAGPPPPPDHARAGVQTASAPEELADALLKSGFRGIAYDLPGFQEALRGSGSLGSHVNVALELLREPKRREGLRKRWDAILETFEARFEGPGEAEALVRQILDFVKDGSAGAEGERLLVAVLARLPTIDDVVRTVETMVLPATGFEVARRIFLRYVERDRSRALRVLVAVAAREESSLMGAALSALVDLAADPAALVEWVREEPRCLARPAVANVVQKTPEHRLRDAFRKLFAGVPSNVAEEILRSIPAGVDGMDQVILAAMLGGSPAVRRCAIAQLPKYPSPRFIGILKVLIERNNRGPLCKDEVEAAIDALRSFDDPAARAVLQEIGESRRFFRHAYRKEIRRALRKGKASNP